MMISFPKTGDGVITKGGRRLSSLDEWHLHAPPKARDHWKDGRSAKENARSWLTAAPGLPAEIEATLRSCRGIGRLRSWRAEPEARVRFDEFRGEPSNIDMLLTGEARTGPVIVAVEAKTDEAFGPTVGKALSDARDRLAANPRSKGVERIRNLVRHFGLDLRQRHVLDLRYQLITVTAAVIAEAQRRSVPRAAVIVHEFVSALTTAGNRVRNAEDLDRFAQAVFGHRMSLQPCAMVGPFAFPGRRKLYFGKTHTAV